MISVLRRKFVVVTTSLMIITFGSFLLINYLYNRYWCKVETADMLDLIANSGYFFYYSDKEVEESLKNITEGYSPIVGIITDASGNIISKKIIGGKRKEVIPEAVIKKVLAADACDYEVDHYLYSIRKLDEEKKLIVIMDTKIDENLFKKIIGISIIIISGIFLLILITFYLSKFVTQPAENALLREKRFISDASHELKTPLGAIKINAQALKVSEQENIYIKNIVSEADRMQRLIERLLTLSEFDEEKESEKNLFSLSDLATEMVLTYESVAFEKGLEYKYNIEEDISILANDDEIRQLLAILIDNAIKNAGEKGFVEISCKTNNSKAQIDISNSGPGIAEEDLPHIFERFYTSDKSRNNKSFGLGLAIAKAIVQNNKGSISVKSNQKDHTVFTVLLKSE